MKNKINEVICTLFMSTMNFNHYNHKNLVPIHIFYSKISNNIVVDDMIVCSSMLYATNKSSTEDILL